MQNSPLSDDDCKVFQVHGAWYCYVPITKVSSTYLRRALPGTQFNIHTWQWYVDNRPGPNKDDMHYLVVLRDPVERWVSGVLEYWCRAYPDHDWSPTEPQHWLFEQIEFDVHTRPQVDFLHAVVKEKCTWLWMNHAVETNSWFLHNNVSLYVIPDDDRNQGHSRPQIYFGPDGQRSEKFEPGYTASTPSALIQSTVRQVLRDNPQYIEKIKKYYQADYDLIQSVEFYNPD
jgi:hypothetical protein